jgi:hypothetical protein
MNTLIHPREYAETSVRRLLTVLFTLRAQRHLRTLAEHYKWTPEQLAEYECRFIQASLLTPRFAPLPEPIEDDDEEGAV